MTNWMGMEEPNHSRENDGSPATNSTQSVVFAASGLIL